MHQHGNHSNNKLSRHLVGTLTASIVPNVHLYGTLHTWLHTSHSAPSNSSVAHQCSNLRSNTLSHHPVGNLTSHRYPLYSHSLIIWVECMGHPLHFERRAAPGPKVMPLWYTFYNTLIFYNEASHYILCSLNTPKYPEYQILLLFQLLI